MKPTPPSLDYGTHSKRQREPFTWQLFLLLFVPALVLGCLLLIGILSHMDL
jgi:hypothetical protein